MGCSASTVEPGCADQFTNQFGTARRGLSGAAASPYYWTLLAVPNVTAHQSTASVGATNQVGTATRVLAVQNVTAHPSSTASAPITILLYRCSGVFTLPLKG